MSNFFREIRDRGVIKVGIAYLVGAWLVLQLADVIFPAMGLSDKSVTLVLGLLVVGFPLALILAWVFDITSDGIRRTAEPKTGDSPTHVDSGPSIAVVPFPDMSAEGDQEYFCDGLTDELLNVLTCIPNLRVASRTSSFSLKGKEIDLKEVANRFNVAHVLEGSVRKAGNRIRVTAQLIESATDSHLWSETYDRELDDIFAIQGDIAACVLAALKLKLGTTRAANEDTTNAKAYEYFLRGRGYAVSRGDRETQLAAEMFMKAVDLDPGFIRAWINLAEMCANHAVFYGNQAHWREVAKKAGDNLLEIAPDRAESYLARGYAETAAGNYEDSEAAFQKAIALDSKICTAYHYLGRAQWHQGKASAAAESFAAATACNPDDYESPFLASQAYAKEDDKSNRRRFARIGLKRAEKILEDYPDNQRAYYLGAHGLGVLGEKDRAYEWIERALALDPNDLATQYNSACFYATVGEIEKALDCLENSVISRTWIENDSDLDSVRDHPRYQAVLDALQD
ncbi:MAG: adenylate/guanylate cyclase domain-containing protein [Gammaproteobacteria bacterium]|nr:adenylate/guanylate cyclase domain-containing protein [Gammaproteobacteria bacterium]